MRSHRLTLAAWQMLQRLGQPGTLLLFWEDDGRFYFSIHKRCIDLVRPSTIDALDRAGMIRRHRDAVPSYVISDKGLSALRRKMVADELMDEPVSPRLTVVSEEARH